MIKIGGILLKLQSQYVKCFEEIWSKDNYDEEEYYDEMIKLNKTMKNVISDSIDVTECEWINPIKKQHYEPFTHFLDENMIFMQEASEYLDIKVFVPKSKRKYEFDVRYDESVVENFNILYNGKFYLVYSKYDSRKSNALLGQEAREILKKILKKSEDWEPKVLPPCPFHPNIIINFVKSDCNLYEISYPVISKDEVNYYFYEEDEENLKDILLDIMMDSNFESEVFLSQSTLKAKIRKIEREIQEQYEEILNMYKDSGNKNKNNLFYKRSKNKEILEKIFKIYISINNYSLSLYEYKKLYNDLIEHTENAYELFPFKEYFATHDIIKEIPMETIKETVKFIDEKIKNNDTSFYTIMAAIIGAILGVFATNIPKFCIFIIKEMKK